MYKNLHSYKKLLWNAPNSSVTLKRRPAASPSVSVGVSPPPLGWTHAFT